MERFIPSDQFASVSQALTARDKYWVINDVGLFSRVLGDLTRARRAFACCVKDGLLASGAVNNCIVALNLSDLEFGAGHFPEALRYSEVALSLARSKGDASLMSVALAFGAAAQFALGNVQTALSDFQRATQLMRVPLRSLSGIVDVECKLLRGRSDSALTQAENNYSVAKKDDFQDDMCRYGALLAVLLIDKQSALAHRHLENAQTFANDSGSVELQLRCFVATTEVCKQTHNFGQGILSAESGILLADTCGFGKYSIDLRLSLAEVYLAAGESRKALQSARSALDLSTADDCYYAWGEALAMHISGVAHLKLDEPELARQRLTAALERRQRLLDPRAEETLRALQK